MLLLFISQISFSQEGLPVYSDYLSDNYFLLHPSMAGAASCAKVRLTARQQWFGQDNAPALQTLSFNGRLSDRSGAGIIVFNDVNVRRIFKFLFCLPIGLQSNEKSLDEIHFSRFVFF